MLIIEVYVYQLSCNGEGFPWPLSALLGCQVLDLQQLPAAAGSHREPHQQQHFSALSLPPHRDEAFINKLQAFLSAAPSSYQQQAAASDSSSTDIDSSLPLLLFPEEATTNGRVALLK